MRYWFSTIRTFSGIALWVLVLTLAADAAQLSLGAWQELGFPNTEGARTCCNQLDPQFQISEFGSLAFGDADCGDDPEPGMTAGSGHASLLPAASILSLIILLLTPGTALSAYAAPFRFGAASLLCVWARCSASQASASGADRKA